MDIENAQQLMADAVKATLACGQHQAAKAFITKALVADESENVTCLIFGSSEEVLDVIARRVSATAFCERLEASKTDAITPEQREQLDLITRSDPTFIVMHLREQTNFDAALVQKVFELAKERARALLDLHS